MQAVVTPSSLGKVWLPHQERSLKTCSRTAYGVWPLGSGKLVLPLNLGAQPPLRAAAHLLGPGWRVGMWHLSLTLQNPHRLSPYLETYCHPLPHTECQVGSAPGPLERKEPALGGWQTRRAGRCASGSRAGVQGRIYRISDKAS